MIPHPCPYCNTKMHRCTYTTGRVQNFKCTGCEYAEGAPADLTRQDTILPL